MKLIVKNGKKYYPVGKFTKYQHVFYNYEDRMANIFYDAQDFGTIEEYEVAEKRFERAQELLDLFNTNPQNADGIVFALYNDYKEMKDVIGGYAYRHGGMV